MTDFSSERQAMVANQIAARGIGDHVVLEAFRRVPREAFVPAELIEFAYEDSALPIAEQQTVSQPYIVALMVEEAGVGPDQRVLEVGTGSGYAAAILAEIAGTVFTIERHSTLAEVARRRLADLGYDNVAVRVGDGSLGWPEAAPFDAILVAAGGPEIPDALRRQLAIGGRLIIPVGQTERRQRLRRIVRTGPDSFDDADLGPVAFVPLVGDAGWDGQPSTGSNGAPRAAPSRAGDPAVDLIRQAAEPLPAIDDPAFAALADRLADARVVLLGEATHGTSEFYRARAALTRRLIERHGFNIVALEADWPDAWRIDGYVQHRRTVPPTEPAFARFPTWMWRNAEMQQFVEWLRRHNGGRAPGQRAGCYGMDLYSLGTSVDAVIAYLDQVDPAAAAVARERYGCLTPWQSDPAAYGRAALNAGYAACEEAVVTMLGELLEKRLQYMTRDPDSFIDAAQNARLVAAAEAYYRALYHGTAESWNLRDSHMFETLEILLRSRGEGAKVVAWAHNSHVGDARATAMACRGEHNLGQLCRESFSDAALLVGFGTDRGTVAAASDWGGPVEMKTIRPAHPDSYERACHDSGMARFHLDLRPDRHPALRHELRRARLQRAIGVIYRPETEMASHYLEASLSRQFDLYIWFDETSAVAPLPAVQAAGAADTFPFGI